jgi:hypothetical protein
MPNVICFGRELANVEFDTFEGERDSSLYVDGNFVGYFPTDQMPLEAYCNYLEHGRFERAELLALRAIRIEDPEMVLAHHFFGKRFGAA